MSDLQRGGNVIVMRHASSPIDVPDKAAADLGNSTLERQLDGVGRKTAVALGEALRELKIPIGLVISSPTYRALETIRLAQLPTPIINDELGDSSHSMQSANASKAVWLRKQAALFPADNNTFIVTHSPNINAAFPQYSMGLADGEALIFSSDGKGGSVLLARIKIEDWSSLK
ncbi:MAG: histidine phosphatase family protein [Steroidobacteraceae bacterium]